MKVDKRCWFDNGSLYLAENGDVVVEGALFILPDVYLGFIIVLWLGCYVIMIWLKNWMRVNPYDFIAIFW